MGAGLFIFFASIFVFVLLLIISIAVFKSSKKAASAEAANIELNYSRTSRPRTDIFFMYAALLMAFYHEFWLGVLEKLLVDIGDPGLFIYILEGISDWDSWGEIAVYWRSLLIVYVIVLIRLFLFDKKYGIKWYNYNNYVVASFNLLLFPFMVLGFVDWAFQWNLHNLFEEF
jgi:hypothetical protein